MTTTQTPTRQVPTLENACRKVAEEIVDEATSLADLAASLAKELNRGQQFALLRRLADIGRRLHRTGETLCDISDQKSNIL